MSDEHHESVSEDPMDWQHTAIDEAEEKISDRLRHVGNDYGHGMVDGETLHSNDSIRRYLEGYSDALRYSENIVSNIHRIDSKPNPWDVRDIDNESVQEIFQVLLSEACNENWGNVAANIDRLESKVEEARDDAE